METRALLFLFLSRENFNDYYGTERLLYIYFGGTKIMKENKFVAFVKEHKKQIICIAVGEERTDHRTRRIWREAAQRGGR